MSTSPGPLERDLASSLQTSLAPEHLQVINESRGHSARPGAETHFKVVVVSAAFEGMGLLARHRAINEATRQQLDGGVHALSIHAFTGREWSARGESSLVTPPCTKGQG